MKEVIRRNTVYLVFIFLGLSLSTGCGKFQEDKDQILRVGTSGDYAPFSFVGDSGKLKGFEIELAERFAADHEMQLEFVRFRWPDLLKDLATDRFDVAMSGVTVRADRSLAARFTVPTTTSGAVVIVPSGSSYSSMVALDQAGVRIGVNAGGHLERVTRKAIKKAAVVTSSVNQAVPDLLIAGEIDALVTDMLEAPHWLSRLPGARVLHPFTQDRKAWLVQADEGDLVRKLDTWLIKKEAEGTLAALRVKHFAGTSQSATASPLNALLAAMDERLSLMPAVAESKRHLGKAVEDSAQEVRVLNAAWISVSNEAQQQNLPGPNREAVERFFVAQMEAAKAIQRQVIYQPAKSAEMPPDLVKELRPALSRISDRINRLIIRFSVENKAMDLTALQTMIGKALSTHSLSDSQIFAITEALEGLLQSKE